MSTKITETENSSALKHASSDAPPAQPSQAQRILVTLCVALGGFAALGWETIWQIKTALAIGISSQATALVIATTMGGMAIGTGIAGVILQRMAHRVNPMLLYGLIELFIGVCGFFVNWEFDLVARLDQKFYRAGAESPWVQLLLIVMTMGPSSMAMGASIPVLGLVARQTGSSLGLLYAVNTLGAALGTLLIAFVILPQTGISTAAVIVAGLNVLVASAMFACSRGEQAAIAPESRTAHAGQNSHPAWYLAAFLSGFAIFALEVVVFRAMRAAFLSTTYSFAIMLGAVLLALSVGAYAAKLLNKDRATASVVLALGGLTLFAITPFVERLDFLAAFRVPGFLHQSHFLLALGVIGPLVAILGTLFPLLLDRGQSPLEWGLLHASNTVGAIAGAICAAWLFLPAVGIAASAWILAGLLLVCGLIAAPRSGLRIKWGLAGLAMFGLAVFNQSGIGKARVVGDRGNLNAAAGFKVVAYQETPDFTISVVESNGMRALLIDGFNASADNQSNYMEWMGRLPMLLHEAPQDALIICFGRGETADSLRLENPQRIDVVDLSQAVFDMAPLFEVNHKVLDDPRIHPIVMDGRAWMRRTDRLYDVITLEPMPPTFAGVNALYSRGFYEQAHERLRPAGTIAQWVPYHLITPDQAAAISKAFVDVFPNSVLWVHKPYRTGILVGRKGPKTDRLEWHGLSRESPGRELTVDQIKDAVLLDAEGLARYVRDAAIVTDDNQYLSYGLQTQRQEFELREAVEFETESFRRIDEARIGR